MSRLIDADKFAKLLKANTMSNGTLINTNTMLAVVEKMPTVYDVEKVVAELTKNAYFVVPKWESDIEGRDVIDLVEAIDIVKRGGVE